MQRHITKNDIEQFSRLPKKISLLKKEVKELCPDQKVQGTIDELERQITSLNQNIQSLQSRLKEIELAHTKEIESQALGQLQIAHADTESKLSVLTISLNTLRNDAKKITSAIECKKAHQTLDEKTYPAMISECKGKIQILTHEIKQSELMSQRHYEDEKKHILAIPFHQQTQGKINSQIISLKENQQKLYSAVRHERTLLNTHQQNLKILEAQERDLQLEIASDAQASHAMLLARLDSLHSEKEQIRKKISTAEKSLQEAIRNQATQNPKLQGEIDVLISQRDRTEILISNEENRRTTIAKLISAETLANKQRSTSIIRLTAEIAQHQKEISNLKRLVESEDPELSQKTLAELFSQLTAISKKIAPLASSENKLILLRNQQSHSISELKSSQHHLESEIKNHQSRCISHHNFDEPACKKALTDCTSNKNSAQSSLDALITKIREIVELENLLEDPIYNQLCKTPHEILGYLKTQYEELNNYHSNNQNLETQVAKAEIEEMLQAISSNEENEIEPGSSIFEEKEDQIEGRPNTTPHLTNANREKCYQLCGLLQYINITLGQNELSERIKRILSRIHLDAEESLQAKEVLFKQKALMHYPRDNFKNLQEERYRRKLLEFTEALQPFKNSLDKSSEVKNFYENANALMTNPTLISDDSGALHAHLADTFSAFTKLINARKNQEDNLEWNNKLKTLATQMKSEQPSPGLKRTGIAAILGGLALIADILITQSPIINFQLSNISLLNKMLIINPQLLIPVALGIILLGAGLGLWQRYKEPKGVSKKILATEQAFSQIPMAFFQKPTYDSESLAPSLIRVVTPSAP